MDADQIAIVLAGGEPADASIASELPSPDLVVAADAGLTQASALGLEVDVVVGDFDSVEPETLEQARRSGAEIEPHPVDKDATDLELAVEAARRRGASSVVVVGGGGGRLDHLFGNALLLSHRAFEGLDLEWWVDGYRIVAVRDATTLHGRPGDLVSLLPIGGAARGVSTSGLRWELDGEDLEAGSTRGVSNVLETGRADVSVRSGIVLVAHRRRQ